MALTISELAEQAGVGVPTIRYYERRGIVPEPARSAAGYRQYDDDTVRRVRFVRSAQQLGFSLEEIQELLELHVDDPAACAAVAQKTLTKIGEIDKKVRELQHIRAALAQLVVTCQSRQTSGDCPVLHALDEAHHA